MTRVPVQKQTTGIHSALSKPAQFSIQWQSDAITAHSQHSGLVGCSAVSLGKQILTYRSITVLSSSRSNTPSRPPARVTLETNYPTTWCSIVVDLNLLQHNCKNLKYMLNRLLRLKLYETSGSSAQL
jgi:hypothetical protein